VNPNALDARIEELDIEPQVADGSRLADELVHRR
jgi:hypothetical protein